MLSDADKTPAVVPLIDGSKTPRPALALARRPPPGRPPGALSVSEMVEQITGEVRRAALDELARLRAELDRQQGALRTELAAEVRTATGLAMGALAMNAVVIAAGLTFSRLLPAGGMALALAVLTAVCLGAAKLGGRRSSAPR